jgi:phage tail-like protein
MPPPPVVKDALTATRFELTIDGHSLASFSELEGITTSVDVASTSAGSGGPPQHIPSRPDAPAVVLKRRLTKNIELSAWHELVILGDVAAARKSCSLTMFDAGGAAVARWHLAEAWPQKVEILAGEGSGILTETVTLTCDLLQRVSV